MAHSNGKSYIVISVVTLNLTLDDLERSKRPFLVKNAEFWPFSQDSAQTICFKFMHWACHVNLCDKYNFCCSWIVRKVWNVGPKGPNWSIFHFFALFPESVFSNFSFSFTNGGHFGLVIMCVKMNVLELLERPKCLWNDRDKTLVNRASVCIMII